MWLEAAKQEKLLTQLKGWVQMGTQCMAGIPFKEFNPLLQKYGMPSHAFQQELACYPRVTGS
jgi:hypothetical protein